MNVNAKICTGIAAGISAIGAVVGAYKLGENHGHDQGYIRGYNHGLCDGKCDVLQQARTMTIDAMDEAINYVVKARIDDALKGEGQN